MLKVNAEGLVVWLVACMQLVWHGVAELHHTCNGHVLCKQLGLSVLS